MTNRGLIPLWHFIWIAPLCLALAQCVAGCASDREQAMAYSEPGFVQKPIIYLHVDDPHAACIASGVMREQREGRRIYACADIRSKIDPRHCTIILPKNAPRWLVRHEELHCLKGSYHE